MESSRRNGIGSFLLIWVGQALSLLGSAMTGFGVSVWAWEETGLATALALAGFFFAGATMVASPFAGALVDRWNRKLVMIVSDAAAALSTGFLLVLYATGNLQIWHLFVANAFNGAFQALQWPAYSAAITMLVPKKHYARSSAMISMAEAGAGILAPILAAGLLQFVGLAGIMLLDLATMGLAIGVLFLVHIPEPEATTAGREGQGSFWQESAYGFRYIFKRPSLLGLQLVFFAGNMLSAFGMTALLPMVMSLTGNDRIVLGSVESVAGFGMLAGSLVLSVWGGFKRRVHGVFLGWALSSLLFAAIGFTRAPVAWAVLAFAAMFVSPVINASNQAIWQAKVAPDVQGRVFSVRRLIAQVAGPPAMIVAGLLVDNVLEPAMHPGGALVPVLGPLLGSGPGAGMALMVVLAGVLGVLAGLAGYIFPSVRDVERIMPDHDGAVLAASTLRPAEEGVIAGHADAEVPSPCGGTQVKVPAVVEVRAGDAI